MNTPRLRVAIALAASARSRLLSQSRSRTMTVTTVPAQSPTSQIQSTHQRPFSTTLPDEASHYQSPKSSSDPQRRPNYVLTLHTDPGHHASMTNLRSVYFPPKINKLDAHITLFHALPGQKLDAQVIPAIQDIVSVTKPYRIRATGPFRLKAGVGITVADDIDFATRGKHGRNMTRIIHAELRKKWADWLSDQDSRPVRVHYTVMNKVNDDKVIEKALKELEASFQQGVDVSGGQFHHHSNPKPTPPSNGNNDESIRLVPEGQVVGLTLWRYDDKSGYWADPLQFDFQG